MNNDKIFVESLVTAFGYVQDKKLLKWVLDKNKFYYTYQDNNLEIFTKILSNRRCGGKLVFNDEVLDLMSENINESYLDQIMEYIRQFGSINKAPEFVSAFNFSEKAELLARLLYWGQIMAQEDKYKKYEFSFMGPFSMRDDLDKYDNEFKKQNYYNLKDFVVLWEDAKVYRDGMSYHGDED